MMQIFNFVLFFRKRKPRNMIEKLKSAKWAAVIAIIFCILIILLFVYFFFRDDVSYFANKEEDEFDLVEEINNLLQ